MLQSIVQSNGCYGTYLGSFLGPDATSLIHLSHQLDEKTGIFGWTTDPGQVYLGQSFELSAAGSYNPSTLTATVTGMFKLGTDEGSFVETHQWGGIGLLNDKEKVKIEVSTTFLGRKVKVSGEVEVDKTTGRFIGDVKFTPEDGGDSFPATISGKKTADKWDITGKSTKTTATVNGTTQDNASNGTHTMETVPEPITGLVVLAGVATLAASRRVKR